VFLVMGDQVRRVVRLVVMFEYGYSEEAIWVELWIAESCLVAFICCIVMYVIGCF